MPKPVFKNKPEPAPAQPKPQPTTQPKPKSIAERLADGRQPVQPVQKPNNTRQNIDKFIQETLKSTQQLPSTQPSYSTDAAAIEVETRSYAEEVVRPYIQQNWREPSKGELDVRNPSSVEISFNVSAIGKITEARITRQSNSRVLNNSVQEFLRNMTRLSPLSAIGSKSASLTIIVTMNITN